MKKGVYHKIVLFAIYNMLVLLIILSAIETSLICFFRRPAFIPEFALSYFRVFYKHTRSTIQVETSCAQYDSQLFYLLKPGECTFKNVEFITQVSINRQGLRDTQESLTNPKIIFLGDSFTMGWGVAQEETFPQQIHSMTEKKTLNAGISSYGTAREMLLLDRLDTDSLETLVIQYHPNDADENHSYLANQCSLSISDEKLYDSLCNACLSEQKYYPGKFISKIGRFMVGHLIRSTNNSNPDRERNFVEEAENFLEILCKKSLGPKTNIIVFEIGNRNNSNKFAEAVEKSISLNNYPEQIKRLKVIKLKDVLSEQDYFILDDHLNASGHKKIAQLIFTNL